MLHALPAVTTPPPPAWNEKQVFEETDMRATWWSCVTDVRATLWSCVTDVKVTLWSCVTDMRVTLWSCVTDVRVTLWSCVTDMRVKFRVKGGGEFEMLFSSSIYRFF